jgi:two-component system response regulator
LLPKVDGIEVLRRAHASRTRLLPVIGLPHRRRSRTSSTAITGANSYIRKPVDYDKFMEAVGSLGMYWLLLNERPPAH